MNQTPAHARYLSAGALLILAGITLSGPFAVALVALLAPQPAWQGTETFMKHYSWIQTLPYCFGFLIAGGFLLLVSALSAGGEDRLHILRRAALAFTGVAAGLIFINYALQTAFIPLSLREHPDLASALTMANPNSLGWALEMYGYGILGVATAFMAPFFTRSRRQRFIGRLFALNCVISVTGAVLVPLAPGWVLTGAGMILGALWNVLVAVIMVLILLEFRFGRSGTS